VKYVSTSVENTLLPSSCTVFLNKFSNFVLLLILIIYWNFLVCSTLCLLRDGWASNSLTENKLGKMPLHTLIRMCLRAI
jgi:hypothetical protein